MARMMPTTEPVRSGEYLEVAKPAFIAKFVIGAALLIGVSIGVAQLFGLVFFPIEAASAAPYVFVDSVRR